MGWQLTPVVGVHVAIAVVVGTIALRSWRRTEVPTARSLSALTVTIALWVTATAGYLARTDFAGKRLFSNVSFLAIALVPVLYLCFAAEYANRDRWLSRVGPLPLVVLPAITQVVVWTNPRHGLMWRTRWLDTASGLLTLESTPGVWFWVHSAYSYALVFVATLLVVRMLVVSERVYRGQAAALLVGAFTPAVANVVYLGGLVDIQYDPTPIAFGVTALAFLTAIHRHRILEIVPAAREIARNELMDELVEAVFILDDRGHVVDCNTRAEALVGADGPVVGRPLTELLPDLAAMVRPADADARADGGDRKGEVTLRRDGDRRFYDVRTRHVRRGGGLLTGTVLSLRDVTERRQREQRLNVLNRTLRHDLRNEATVIVGYADLGRQDHPDAAWLDALVDHVDGLVEMSGKVRELEQALDGETEGSRPVDVADVVRRTVARIEAEQRVDVELDLPESAYASAIDHIDWAIENALENAVVHNDSREAHLEVAVATSSDGDDVVIEIADDGPGIDPAERAVLEAGEETQLEHVSGLGLWSIHWLVTESGGAVELAENDPQGSVVTLRLPGASPPASEAANLIDSAEDDE